MELDVARGVGWRRLPKSLSQSVVSATLDFSGSNGIPGLFIVHGAGRR